MNLSKYIVDDSVLVVPGQNSLRNFKKSKAT